MKKILFIIFMNIIIMSGVSAEINKSKCDNIKKWNIIGKADCLAKEKAKTLTKKSSKELEDVNKGKREFDKKNKTLWDMLKNSRK